MRLVFESLVIDIKKTPFLKIGRRYKIMNPGKMRNTYGKMMYMLQDTHTHIVKAETKLSFVKNIVTVMSFLESRDGVEMLNDELLNMATISIDDDEGALSREQLAVIGTKKKEAIEAITLKYTSGVNCFMEFC